MLYEYPGFQNCYSKCELEIVRSSGKTTLVICTELPDNPGTSVTNCAAVLATRVCQEDETIDPETLLWGRALPGAGMRARKSALSCIVGHGNFHRAGRASLPSAYLV